MAASSKLKNEPLFSHEIPQVYNILKSTRAAKKEVTPQQQPVLNIPHQHIPTPLADLSKENKFFNGKNYSSDRFTENSPLKVGTNINFSHSQY